MWKANSSSLLPKSRFLEISESELYLTDIFAEKLRKFAKSNRTIPKMTFSKKFMT